MKSRQEIEDRLVEAKLMVGRLLVVVKANEWQTRHAAENIYCPYCSNDDDLWHDQCKHHKGCEFIATVMEAERLIASRT